ncbi:hypothetical protein DFJ73DRAFT_902548 [Zopfochytrium polystomum]|nr:hypothetical protein DFJ73DRAFT_902548 [Zopfochytrium polystomum]
MYTADCCSIPAVVPSDGYVAKGRYIEIPHGDSERIKCYATGDPACKRAVVVYYDVFGFHKNTEQTCDLLASQRFYVLMVDFFRSEIFPGLVTPPFDRDGMMAHYARVAPWDSVHAISRSAVDHVREVAGADAKVGALGFCWGGLGGSAHVCVCVRARARVAVLLLPHFSHNPVPPHPPEPSQVVRAVSPLPHPLFSAAAGIHPSGVTPPVLRAALRPVCMVASSGEPDLAPAFAELAAARPSLAPLNVSARFDDVHHGFAAARADFAKKLNAERVVQAVAVVRDFFARAFAEGGVAVEGDVEGKGAAL